MSQIFKKQFFVMLGFVLFLCISASAVQAEMSNEEMLKTADKARGN